MGSGMITILIFVDIHNIEAKKEEKHNLYGRPNWLQVFPLKRSEIGLGKNIFTMRRSGLVIIM